MSDRKAAIGSMIESGLLSIADGQNLLANPSLSLEGATTYADLGQGSAVASVATADADATYGTEEATLINELKGQVNALLGELRTLGIIAT